MTQGSTNQQTDPIKNLRGEVKVDFYQYTRDGFRRRRYSFYVLWSFASLILLVGLWVVCNGLKIVNAEIKQSKCIVTSCATSNQTEHAITKNKEAEHVEIKDKEKINNLEASDKVGVESKSKKQENPNKSAAEIAVSVFNSSLIYLAITFSVLCGCFLVLSITAARMYPHHTEKAETNESGIDPGAAYPTISLIQETLKTVAEVAAKKGNGP